MPSQLSQNGEIWKNTKFKLLRQTNKRIVVCLDYSTSMGLGNRFEQVMQERVLKFRFRVSIFDFEFRFPVSMSGSIFDFEFQVFEWGLRVLICEFDFRPRRWISYLNLDNWTKLLFLSQKLEL